MKNLMVNAIATLRSWLQGFQVKQFLAVVLVGFVVLATQADPGRKAEAISKKINEKVHQSDSQRPKTTGEWNREAAENAPLSKRVQQIGEDSAEAVNDFGKVYPNVAKRSADSVSDTPVKGKNS
jgi:hypothetical protein